VNGFVGGGGEVAKAGVAAAGVVPTLDPLEDRGRQLLGLLGAGEDRSLTQGTASWAALGANRASHSGAEDVA